LTATKNAETLALARILPDPDVRGRHLIWSLPEVVVRLDATDADPASVTASLESLLADTDAHVWLGDTHESPVEDPRVHVGSPGERVLDRARWVVDCSPVVVHGATLRALTASAPVAGDHLTIRSTRELRRVARGIGATRARPLPDGVRLEPMGMAPVLERHWQSRTKR
ncbi:MAG: hypothetical protein ABI336_02445, partial [Humibacillus sp.]